MALGQFAVQALAQPQGGDYVRAPRGHLGFVQPPDGLLGHPGSLEPRSSDRSGDRRVGVAMKHRPKGDYEKVETRRKKAHSACNGWSARVGGTAAGDVPGPGSQPGKVRWLRGG